MEVDIRLLPLENSKRGLDLIVLVVLVLNVIVYTRDFLIVADVSVPYATHKSLSTAHLLQHIYELTQGFVRPVFDFVPIEGFKILVNWLCVTVSQDWCRSPTQSSTDCHSPSSVVRFSRRPPPILFARNPRLCSPLPRSRTRAWQARPLG